MDDIKKILLLATALTNLFTAIISLISSLKKDQKNGERISPHPPRGLSIVYHPLDKMETLTFVISVIAFAISVTALVLALKKR